MKGDEANGIDEGRGGRAEVQVKAEEGRVYDR